MFSLYESVNIRSHPHLSSELWVSEIIRLQIQVAEMSFLSRATGLSLRNRVRSLVILRKLGAPAHSD